MGFNHSKIILILLTILPSCSFDPENMKIVSKISDNYYAAENVGYSNEGIMIVFSKDKESFQVLSSNCIEIYQKDTSIFYISNWNPKDTSAYEYYYLKMNNAGNNTSEEPRLIDKNSYLKRTKDASKVILSITH